MEKLIKKPVTSVFACGQKQICSLCWEISIPLRFIDAIHIAEKALTQLGAKISHFGLRYQKTVGYIGSGNILLDCRFESIYGGLERDIKLIPASSSPVFSRATALNLSKFKPLFA